MSYTSSRDTRDVHRGARASVEVTGFLWDPRAGLAVASSVATQVGNGALLCKVLGCLVGTLLSPVVENVAGLIGD